MTGRITTLAIMSAGAALVTFSIWAKPMPRLLWNASASVPIGLYSVQPVGKMAVGLLVVAMPPQPLAAFLANRASLPLGVPLIKPVLALPGQSVCRDGLRITIDRAAAGKALANDSRGRRLPVWRGCRVIAPNEVFLMNPDQALSLDGRYFGPIPASAIVGRATPVRNDHVSSATSLLPSWIVDGTAPPRTQISPIGATFPRFILAGLWIAHWWFKVGYRGMLATEMFFLQQGLPAWLAWFDICFESIVAVGLVLGIYVPLLCSIQHGSYLEHANLSHAILDQEEESHRGG